MLKIKNSQKRRNINVSKSLITCYLSQTSSIFLGPVDLFIMFFAVQEMNNCPIQRKRSYRDFWLRIGRMTGIIVCH